MNWHLFSTRLLFATGLLAAQAVGGQTAYVWSGGSGDWATAANWTPNGVPGALDTVIINNGGSVTVSVDTSVSSLNLTNSTVTGTATLTVTNSFHWAGGTVNGSGTLTLLATVNGTISGSSAKFLDGGRAFDNQGTLVWTGTGQIRFDLGTWNNSGLLDCQSDATMSDGSGSGVGSFFNNSGTVRKSGAAGTTTFGSLQSFENSGTLDVQSGSVTMSSTPFHNNGTARTQAGTLTLGSGGGTGSGTFEAASPGLVSFTAGTHTLTNGARLIGTGTNQVAGATVTFPDDVGAERLEVTGGTINGTGTVTVTNGFYWSGGTLGGSGTLTLLATVNGTISSSNTKFLDGGRVLNNQGTLVWTGGQVNLRQGTWNNSGLLDCQLDSTMSDDSTSGVGSFFNNTGTVRKSAGTSTTSFSSLESFANSGTVDVQNGSVTMSSTPFHNNGTARTQAGVLTLGTGGGTGGGTFEAVSPGLVSFTGGTHTLTNGARLIGTGTNQVAGATVTFPDDVGAERLEVTGGTVNGTGTVTVTNGFHWRGGTMTGTGTLTLLGSVNGTISSTATKTLDGGRMLNNQGTLVWTGGAINLNLGTWNNSGLLDCQLDGTMSDGSGSLVGSFFNNTGTVRKSAGTATTTFSAIQSFANSGTLDVVSGSLTMSSTPFHNNGTARTQAGTLTVASGGTGGGTFEAVSPGLVSFTGGTTTLTNSARLIGTGTNQVNGATVTLEDAVGAERLEVVSGTLNGAGTVTVTNEFHWRGGTVGGTGTLTLLGTVNGTISGSNTKFVDGGRVLNNAGTLVWTGGAIRLDLGTWNNSGLLDCQSDITMSDGSNSGVGSFFNNTGTVRKSADTGTTTFSALQSFANNATVEVLTGIVSVPSTYSMTGSSVHRFGLGGTAPGTGYGRLQINGATTLSGALEAVLVSGFSPAAGDTFLVVTFTSRTGTFASFSGPSGSFSDQYYGTTVAIHVLGAATYTWKGANANWADPTQWTPDGVPGAGDTANIGSGSAMIGAATTVATLNLSGGAVSGAGPLNITGTFNWTGGNREGPGVTAIQPGAVLNLSGPASKGFFFHTLENAGTINWDGTGPWSGHSAPVLSNLASGVINILSDAALTRFNNAAVIHNAGTIRKTGGTNLQLLEITLNNTGAFEVNSGRIQITDGFTNRNSVVVGEGRELIISGSPGASSGQFQIATNGYVSYTGGNQALETNCVVSGDGFLYVGGSANLAVNGAVTVRNLQQVAATLRGTGPLTIGGTWNWTGGNHEGPGLTAIQPGAVLNISGASSKGFFFHTLENAGTINWDGTGPWSGHTGPVLSNLASGVINLMSDAELTRFNNSAVIHNAGAIRKTGGTGTKTLDVVFSSTGTLEVNSGRLDIISGFTNRNQVTVAPDCQLVISGASGASSGQFQVGANALLSYTSGNQALETNAIISGDGFLNVGGTANLAVKGTVTVQNLQLVAGAISSAGPLTIGGVFNWTGGNREGPGLTVIQPAAVVNLTGSGSKGFFFHTLENAGTINWDGTGAWSGHSGPVLSNLASGVINLMSDAALTRFNSSAVIHNAGLICKTGGTGTQTMDVVVTNSGTLDIRTGVLSIVNSYTPTATSTHRFAVGGYDVGTGYGRLTASGTVALAGQLDLMLTNSFVPTNNATFVVLTANTRTGTFSSVTGRGVGGGLYFNPVYSSTAVTLTVADGTPSIAANSAAWVDGKFQFRLNGVASETYRVDASTNLVNWSAISTNALSGTAFLDFVDNDSPLFPHRFYRGVFLP